MPTVDELFERFRATGGDPRHFLDQLSGADRRELEALIFAHLERADTPEDVDRFRASPAGARLRAAVDARVAETWPELLPHLRNEAEITRATLVQRLAAALGVGDREPKVGSYYHRMETGDLEPSGVSDRVLEALAAIVGASAERLRAAGRRVTPPALEGAVFARAAAAPPAAAGGAAPAPKRARAERDEVDELFTAASD
jgi:hypothetical protein